MSKRLLLWGLVHLCICAMPARAHAQDIVIPDTPPVDKPHDWNEFDLKFSTARAGFAMIHEYAAYKQDDIGKKQMELAGVTLENQWKFRDFRFFSSGRLNMKRTVIWRVAAMYDGAVGNWTFRETGFLIAVPKARGHMFIGRSKEGYSMYKVQNGYSTWGNERQMSLDLVPIMTDGIRYYGYSPQTKLFWSIGAFTGAIYGHNNKFALWQWNYAGRFGWRPVFENNGEKTVHVGFSYRYARPDLDKIQVRSRPESNPAPYFLDTGKFSADRGSAIGWEAYYQNGPLLLGTEANTHSFRSVEAGDPRYFGQDYVAAYTLTGEHKPYLSDPSVFHFVKPTNSVFRGGLGGWELQLRYSSYNLNKGLLPGGSFWKITPMVNWYISPMFRMEVVYGYGVLDRFNLKGATHFFQTRFQVQIM